MSLPESLVAELAGANVAASSELRARVREIAARAPEPRRSRLPRFSPRRAAFVLAPAVVIAGLGAALAGGLVSSTRSSAVHGEKAAAPLSPTVEHGAKVFGAATVPQELAPVIGDSGAARSAATPSPNSRR